MTAVHSSENQHAIAHDVTVLPAKVRVTKSPTFGTADITPAGEKSPLSIIHYHALQKITTCWSPPSLEKDAPNVDNACFPGKLWSDDTDIGPSQTSQKDDSQALFGTKHAEAMDVILYTRQGCHLCDQASELLRAHGLTAQLIDIDSDPQLLAQYDCCVPVVAIDGKVRFRGRVNEVLLRRLLAKSRPNSKR
jgi:glutaredoxin